MIEHPRVQSQAGDEPGASLTRGPETFDCVLSAWRGCEAELRGYLIHRLGETHAADDVLQDVFLKSMRVGNGFCEVANPRAWLFQVARNALVDRARMTKPQEEVTEHLIAPAASSRDRPFIVHSLFKCSRTLGFGL